MSKKVSWATKPHLTHNKIIKVERVAVTNLRVRFRKIQGGCSWLAQMHLNINATTLIIRLGSF